MLAVSLQCMSLVTRLSRGPFSMQCEQPLRALSERKPVAHHVKRIVVPVNAESDYPDGSKVGAFFFARCGIHEDVLIHLRVLPRRDRPVMPQPVALEALQGISLGIQKNLRGIGVRPHVTALLLVHRLGPEYGFAILRSA